VHERNLRSGLFDGRSLSRDVGQRFATERSTKVPEKDHQHRRTLGERVQRLG
jgi:hypothetical protein